VPPLLLAQGRPVGAEDIRDLQGRTVHEPALRGGAGLQRSDHLAQDVGADLGVERRGLQPMTQQDLDHPDIDLLLEQMRAARAASCTARFNCRELKGSTGFRPGNSQPPSSILPCARATRHQVRSRCSITGENIA